MTTDENRLGYAVGDTVYIFGRYRVEKGECVKVTPSGLVDVRAGVNVCGVPIVRRFRPNGSEQGASAWATESIVGKSDQATRYARFQQAHGEKTAIADFRNAADALKRHTLSDAEGRGDAARALHAMLARLENWGNWTTAE